MTQNFYNLWEFLQKNFLIVITTFQTKQILGIILRP